MTAANKTLLIVAHTPSPNTRELADALLRGAKDEAISGVSAELRSPFHCDAELVLNSDTLILFTTENFGYMSMVLKDLSTIRLALQ